MVNIKNKDDDEKPQQTTTNTTMISKGRCFTRSRRSSSNCTTSVSKCTISQRLRQRRHQDQPDDDEQFETMRGTDVTCNDHDASLSHIKTSNKSSSLALNNDGYLVNDQKEVIERSKVKSKTSLADKSVSFKDCWPVSGQRSEEMIWKHNLTMEDETNGDNRNANESIKQNIAESTTIAFDDNQQQDVDRNDLPCSQISNPFEIDIESKIEHFTTDNSMLIDSSVTKHHGDSDVLQYSIDEMSVIRPINITQGEIEQSLNACNDYTNDVKVQNAITKFFKNNIIVPSPIDSAKTNLESKLEDGLRYIEPKISKDQDSFGKSEPSIIGMVSSSFQTDISLPSDYDLEELLAKNLIQDPKLFNHINSLYNISSDNNEKTLSITHSMSLDSNSARKLFSPEPIHQNITKNNNLNLGINMFSPPPTSNIDSKTSDNCDETKNPNIFFSPPVSTGTRHQTTPSTGEKIRQLMKSPSLTPILAKNSIKKLKMKNTLLNNIKNIIHKKSNEYVSGESNIKLSLNSDIECKSCNCINFIMKCNSCGNSITLNPENSMNNNLSESFIDGIKQVMVSTNYLSEENSENVLPESLCKTPEKNDKEASF